MIYLDSAATSLRKPPAVASAVSTAMRTMASPGRGGHPPAMAAAATLFRCREKAAALLGAPAAENVAFTFNATHGLNIAIRSLVKPGDRVLVSAWEHNAVMRPLYALGADITVIDAPMFEPERFLRRAAELLPRVDAVICSHVSNVFGCTMPVYELGELCSKQGKAFIVDASQSAGCLELDFEAIGADFLACPGHKGLLGPQGTGLLLCKNEAKPLLYGGSGGDSAAPSMPELLPERLEAGTHNTAGIAGLEAGIDYVSRRGTVSIRRHERRCMEMFVCSLGTFRGKLFLGPCRLQTGLVSLVPEGMEPEDMAERLAREGIAVRAGLHCAPLAHKSAGSFPSGTVRFSFSPFVSPAEAQMAGATVKKILKKI